MEQDAKKLTQMECLRNKYQLQLSQLIQEGQTTGIVDNVSLSNLNQKIQSFGLKMSVLENELNEKYMKDESSKEKFKKELSKWIDKCDELTKDFKEEEISTSTEQIEKKKDDPRKMDISNTVIGTWGFSINGTPCKMNLKTIFPIVSDNLERGFVDGELIVGNGKPRKFKVSFSTKDVNPHIDVYTNEIKILLTHVDFEGSEIEKTEEEKDLSDKGDFHFKISINSNKGTGEWKESYTETESYKYDLLKE
jgi:hypothetical protein